jgi:hypothetical protein
MANTGVAALIVGAALSAAAALAHLVCILVGAPGYRFLGAGAKMVRAAELGKVQPTAITLCIAGVLIICALYALGGAGVTAPLPFAKVVLPGICAVYLGRALFFPLLKPAFPENSRTFWLVSSGICLAVGLVHLYGVVMRWPAL